MREGNAGRGGQSGAEDAAPLALAAAGLEKGFGGGPVLGNLDLTVAWGEFLVIFGANGSGKTTLLRILSGQTRPDGGSVQIAGFDLRRQGAAARRRVGVVSHRGLLYDDLTGRENLTFYGRLYALSDLPNRVSEVLARVGMSQRADRRVRSLSHGMQKRLSIARALLHRPPLLLLDEPESGLDRDSVAALADILREWTAAGRSVVMTTHNAALGLAWGSRAAALTNGKLDLAGAADYVGVLDG